VPSCWQADQRFHPAGKGEIVATEVDPMDNNRGSVEYKDVEREIFLLGLSDSANGFLLTSK